MDDFTEVLKGKSQVVPSVETSEVASERQCGSLFYKTFNQHLFLEHIKILKLSN